MKYTRELVLKSCMMFLPNFNAVPQDQRPGLQEFLRLAAEEIFVNPINGQSPQDFYAAEGIIRTALLELKSVGWVEFGTVNDFWM